MKYSLTKFKEKHGDIETPLYAKYSCRHCHGTGTTGTVKGKTENKVLLCKCIGMINDKE